MFVIEWKDGSNSLSGPFSSEEQAQKYINSLRKNGCQYEIKIRFVSPITYSNQQCVCGEQLKAGE